MTAETPRQSDFYLSFESDLRKLATYHDDPLMNRLLFSHVITIMEKYLSDLFIYEISNNDGKLKRLANQNKFKVQKVTVEFALNNSVPNLIIDAMKRMVWHRLNDIQVFYKEVLGIPFELERDVINAINKRHHLVHRNGFDFEGNTVPVNDEELRTLISMIDEFISNIDEKYINLQHQ